MSKLSKAEQKKILESPPIGTWTLLLLMAALFIGGWAYMYFGIFLAHGPIS